MTVDGLEYAGLTHEQAEWVQFGLELGLGTAEAKLIAKKVLTKEAAELAMREAANRLAGELAEQATHNAASRIVVLGKELQDGISYFEEARKLNATYFKFDDWDSVVKNYRRDQIWNANEAFLKKQIQNGKQIFLTHNPFTANGAFRQEVDFLTQLGYTFRQNGTFWEAFRP